MKRIGQVLMGIGGFCMAGGVLFFILVQSPPLQVYFLKSAMTDILEDKGYEVVWETKTYKNPVIRRGPVKNSETGVQNLLSRGLMMEGLQGSKVIHLLEKQGTSGLYFFMEGPLPASEERHDAQRRQPYHEHGGKRFGLRVWGLQTPWPDTGTPQLIFPFPEMSKRNLERKIQMVGKRGAGYGLLTGVCFLVIGGGLIILSDVQPRKRKSLRITKTYPQRSRGIALVLRDRRRLPGNREIQQDETVIQATLVSPQQVADVPSSLGAGRSETVSELEWETLLESIQAKILLVPAEQQSALQQELDQLESEGRKRVSIAYHLLDGIGEIVNRREERQEEVDPDLNGKEKTIPQQRGVSVTVQSSKKERVPTRWFENRQLKDIFAGLERTGWRREEGAHHTLLRRDGSPSMVFSRSRVKPRPPTLAKKFRDAGISLEEAGEILNIKG